jgi:hypothetical protein
VRGQRFHHRERIGIGIAAGKSDQLYARIVSGIDHAPRHVMGAFDEVDHQHRIADALASIGAQIAFDHAGSPAVPPVASRKCAGM